MSTWPRFGSRTSVHNKGIVVDFFRCPRPQSGLVHGVLRSPDASLIVFDAEAAQYFETTFIHDWTTLAHQSVHA